MVLIAEFSGGDRYGSSRGGARGGAMRGRGGGRGGSNGGRGVGGAGGGSNGANHPSTTGHSVHMRGLPFSANESVSVLLYFVAIIIFPRRPPKISSGAMTVDNSAAHILVPSLLCNFDCFLELY